MHSGCYIATLTVRYLTFTIISPLLSSILPPLSTKDRGSFWTSYHDLGCSYLHTVGNSNRVKSSFFCGVWMLKIFAKCIIIPNKYCIMADILSWNLKYNIFVIFLMSRAIWYFLTTFHYQFCNNNSRITLNKHKQVWWKQ